MSGGVQDYPRIHILYSYYHTQQIASYTRYATVVAAQSSGARVAAVFALKAANPAVRALLYVDSSAVVIPGFNTYTIAPCWWLTLAGTTLAAPMTDTTGTTITVTDAALLNTALATNPDVLVDNESMHITSVDVGAKTLTVVRGYNSTPATHTVGTRIAAHAVNWPQSWMLNVTSSCPTDPLTGLTWAQFLATTITTLFPTAPWDGVFFDNATWTPVQEPTHHIDADSDNVVDAASGAAGYGWTAGEAALFASLRAESSMLLVGNGGYYAGGSSGELFEQFPRGQGNDWHTGLQEYLSLAGPSRLAPHSLLCSDTSDTGVLNLQVMRFGLGSALLGNGSYGYDSGPASHGQTWWFDEYDQGAGSSLASGSGTGDTSLTLALGTGSRFHPNDVVFLPGDTGADDEQVLVSAVSGDVLTVTRAQNGSAAATHGPLCKVFTQAQLAAGQGWLGQPVHSALRLLPDGANLVTNGTFDTSLAGWATGTSAPAVGTFAQDSTTALSGGSSLKVVVTTGNPVAGNGVRLRQGGFSLIAGKPYTCLFWAKGSAQTSIELMVQLGVSPFTVYAISTFPLTPEWQECFATFLAPATVSAVNLQFDFAYQPGTIWLDNVSWYQGDPHLWRRDFEHGVVLVNGTSTSQTVTLGAGYTYITGTQDAVQNPGGSATTVTIAPSDALLLAGTPPAPPSAARTASVRSYGARSYAVRT